MTHADFFGGTWSLVPDPVDFRAFQLVNLYAPGANMYRDRNGDRVPCGRRQGQVTLWYDDFCAMEVVHGEGGQLSSFDAVFSPRGPDGRPLPFFNRATGMVDPQVVQAWAKYDIRLLLEANWPELAPRLAGKLHVYAGEDDNFYLEDAAKLLKRSLEKLGSDAVVEILPGKNHGTVLSADLLQQIDRQLLDKFDRALSN